MGWREESLSLSFLGAYSPVFAALQLLVLYSTDLHVGLRQVLPVGITQNENLLLLRVHFIAAGVLEHRHGAH